MLELFELISLTPNYAPPELTGRSPLIEGVGHASWWVVSSSWENDERLLLQRLLPLCGCYAGFDEEAGRLALATGRLSPVTLAHFLNELNLEIPTEPAAASVLCTSLFPRTQLHTYIVSIMARVRPLSPGQQKFLQMLMARHVLSDSEAQALYTALSRQAQEEDEEPLGRSLEHCLGVINDSLSAGFGLEIKTVSLDKRCAGPMDEDADAKAEDETEEESSSAGGARKSSAKKSARKNKNRNTARYHAVANKVADPASKSTFMTATAASAPHHSANIRTPHEMAYLRLIVEKIVERGMDMDEAGGAEGVGAGSRGCLGRISVLNLRNELEGPHEGKVSLAQAQHALSCLIGEKWLVATNPPEDDEDDDEEGDEETETLNAGKRKRGGRKSRGGRTSLDGLGGDGPALSHVMVGPRTYMELPDLLKDCGLERVPQFILHSGR